MTRPFLPRDADRSAPRQPDPGDSSTTAAPLKAPGAPGRISTCVGLGLLALVVLAFPRVVTGERSFFHLDLFYEFTPIWHAVQQAMLTGGSPFWLSGQYCGHPLLFTQEVPLFYPLTPVLLLSGLPAHRLTDVFTLFHFWLAGVSAFVLVRERTEGHLGASVFAAIGWMLSARTLQSSIWPSSVATMALLPLIVLGLSRLGQPERRASGVAWTAFAGALSLLTWRVQSLWGSVPLLATIAVGVVLSCRDRARAAAALVIASCLGLGLAAPALLTAAAVYPETARAGGLDPEQRNFGALSEGRQIDQVFLPVDGLRRWPEAAAYPGVAAFLLLGAALGLALRRSAGTDRRFLLILVVAGTLSLVFAFGEAGPYRFVADLPVIRGLRVPARFLVGWSFLLAIGSSLAVPAVERRLGRWGPPATGLAVVLFAGDLVSHAWRSAPTVPGDVYRVEPRIVRYLRELPPDESGATSRYWTLAPGLPIPALTDASKAEAVAALEPLAHARGFLYGLRGASGAGPALARTERLLSNRTLRAARLAGAHRLILGAPDTSLPLDDGAPPGLNVHFVPDPLPHAFVVPRAVVVPGDQAIATALRGGFDPRAVVIVEEELLLPHGAARAVPEPTARFLVRGGGRFELATDSPVPGVLVVLESWERGWAAEVDGEVRPVLRTNGAFLGVAIGSGSHRVSLVYRPPLLREGTLLAGASALGLALYAVRARRSATAAASPGRGQVRVSRSR